MRRAISISLVLLAVACSSSSTTSSPAPSPAPSATSPAVDAGGASADTWDSYANGFVTTYCVECHDAKDKAGRDYTLEAKVLAEKDEIRCGVASAQDASWGCASFPPAKQFPIGTGAKPTDAERARFVAWITAGAP